MSGINHNDIANIADMLTDDPDTFAEAKKSSKRKRKGKVDEIECEDDFDIEASLEQQLEPRKPGAQTRKTTMRDVGSPHSGTLKESRDDDDRWARVLDSI